MKTGYKVCDAMTEKPVTVSPNASLQQCAKLMAQEHVGSLLIKEGNKVVGIITEQDIVRKSVVKNELPSNKKAKDIMETNLMTISPEKDVFDALTAMRDYNIRHLPVMDDETLVGFVTLKDILKLQPELFELLLDKFELREEERKPVHLTREKEGSCEVCGEYSEALVYSDGNMVCANCKE